MGRLEEIEQRVDYLLNELWWPEDYHEAKGFLREDLPWLIARVRELEDENQGLFHDAVSLIHGQICGREDGTHTDQCEHVRASLRGVGEEVLEAAAD